MQVASFCSFYLYIKLDPEEKVYHGWRPKIDFKSNATETSPNKEESMKEKTFPNPFVKL